MQMNHKCGRALLGLIASLVVFNSTSGLATESKSMANSAMLDTTKSKVTWFGKKPAATHSGTVNIMTGDLKIENGLVKAGTFELDMNSIDNQDLTGEWKTKLVGHLKSDEFFNVAKFPKAKFELTSVTQKTGDEYEFKGKLTIKDITNEISFPGTIKNEKGVMKSQATIKIDRTLWGIKYNSAKFFDVNKLLDKVINDEVEFKLELVTTAPADGKDSKGSKKSKG